MPSSDPCRPFLDRFRKLLSESFPRTEQTRADGPHEAPKFAQMIFHRRTGQRQAPIGIDAANSPRRLRLKILDVLGFVQHQRLPLSRGESIGISLQQLVARDDQIARGGRFDQVLPIMFAIELG